MNAAEGTAGSPSVTRHNRLATPETIILAIVNICLLIFLVDYIYFKNYKFFSNELFSNNRISLTPDQVDSGTVERGQPVETYTTLTNVGGRPVRILGARSNCNCVAITEMPFWLGPGEKKKVGFRVNTSVISLPGPTESRAIIYDSNSEDHRFRINYEILK